MTSEEHPGKTGADLAALTLRQAKETARRRPPERAARTARTRIRPRRQPTGIREVILDLLHERAPGVFSPGTPMEVNRMWRQTVGREAAARLRFVDYAQQTGLLTVIADSKTWHFQAQLLRRRLVANLRERGCPVSDIRILPPSARSLLRMNPPERMPEEAITTRPGTGPAAPCADPRVEAAVRRQQASTPRELAPYGPAWAPREAAATRQQLVQARAVHKARRARASS
ncbi:DciA family protein [Streptomyces sp. NPDC054796]